MYGLDDSKGFHTERDFTHTLAFFSMITPPVGLYKQRALA